MTNRSGFIVKRAYPGKKGLYVEFFTTEDAEGFYAKGVATNSRVEKQDDLTVIMKFSEASNLTELTSLANHSSDSDSLKISCLI